MGGWAIAVHGGAGVDPDLPLHRQDDAKKFLTRCLDLGIHALRSNHSAIDVVELVVSFPFPSHSHLYIHHLFLNLIYNQQFASPSSQG